MSVDRRRFLSVSAASLSSALLAACNANPRSAAKLLAFAERRNTAVEEGLFRHGAMNHVPASARLTGEAFPKYFVSEHVPMWDVAARGAWRLEVSGAVRTPVTLSLDDLQRLPAVTQKV